MFFFIPLHGMLADYALAGLEKCCYVIVPPVHRKLLDYDPARPG